MLNRYWPLDPGGPLPPPLADRTYVGEAFFQSLPAQSRWPSSAIRRGLKQEAKRLGIKFERSNTKFDQRERDESLAFEFASSPIGRDALRNVEIYIDRSFGRRAWDQGAYRIAKTLPEIFWTRYLEDARHAEVVAWAKASGVARPDLGGSESFFLTAASLGAALAEGPPPLALDDVELARVVLLFAALLPLDEAVELIEAAASLGISGLDGADAGAVKPANGERPTPAIIEFMEGEPVVPPHLPPTPPLILSLARLPPPGRAALDIMREISVANAAASEAEEAVRAKDGPITSLFDLDEDGFDSMVAAVRHARRSREALRRWSSRAREFLADAVAGAAARVGLDTPGWVGELPHLGSADLADMVPAADALAALAEPGIGKDFSDTWLAAASASNDLGGLLETFRQLPAYRSHGATIAEHEKDFVTRSRAFALAPSTTGTDVAAWLARMSAGELRALLAGVEYDRWPVVAALLARLGMDRDPGFARTLEQFLTSLKDGATRRRVMHLVDPTSASFDGLPDLQRLLITERLRDILAFGPLVAITDPSARLRDARLIGPSVVNLVDLLIQHLDLLSTGAALRRLANPEETTAEAAGGAAAGLVSYATSVSSSSGLYHQLREAVRERHFATLVHSGQIDIGAATELERSLDVDDAMETAIADIRREGGRATRIEPRHRTRTLRYIRHGKDLLEAFVQPRYQDSSARLRAFRSDLAAALSLLGDNDSSIGSREWLEAEVRRMFVGSAPLLETPTLRGDPTSLTERAWTTEDVAWAQQSMDLPEFYLRRTVATLDVAAASLRQWAAGRDLSPAELLDHLLAGDQFAAALAFAKDAAVDPAERSAMLDLVAKAAGEVTDPLRRRLVELEARHGKEALGSTSTTSEVLDALERLEPSEAAEQLDFLEMELGELEEANERKAPDESTATERAALLRRLLKAGVEGPDERWTLVDLESRWDAELRNRAPERAHLRVVEKALGASEALAELGDDARDFSARMLEPERWLLASRANELTSFVEAPADKLRTWLQLAGQLDEAQRRALVEVTRWFVRFVEDLAEGLQTLDEGASSDAFLERALEVGDVIEQALDPALCAHGLGLSRDDPPPTNIQGRPVVQELMVSRLAPLAERSDWPALAEASRALRLDLGDEDARRVTEIAEFADTLVALADGRLTEARDGLVTVARVLGASGQIVNRALPMSRLMATAYDVMTAAVALGDKSPGTPAKSQADGSWTPLLGKRAGLQQALAGHGLAARVLEQLCSGPLGREVIVRIWEAPTAMAEPGALRAELLGFLHERGLNEHLLLLAGRYDPAIRARLEQLINLRKIVLQRPDLVSVSEAVAIQVAKAAQGVPFRTFVTGLPSAAQPTDADLVVGVDNDIVLRIDRRKPAELSVAISIEPRGLVPESLEAILFPDDDVSFDDGSRRRRLSDQPVYFAGQWTVGVRFGDTWNDAKRGKEDTFRIRVNARVLAGELINRDVVCQLTRAHVRAGDARRIDDETLLDIFPGVENTPALGESFIGRHEELERLHGALVGARRPSPVLLTGMRRIGKTSLLYAFHNRYRRPERDKPVTVYFSLAERRASMMDPSQQVGAVFYGAIAQALGKRHFGSGDLNGDLAERLRQRLGTDRDAVRNAILELRDPESLADSVTVLSERLLEWAGGATRVIYLVDEAETLVLPYRGGEAKRLELEQLMQGLREVSQTSSRVGLLLSGSNHIAEFARSYKNAFFGSSLQIDLAGMTSTDTARKLVSPDKLAPYIGFGGEPVRYAVEMCAGMPQFLWQLGAATSAIVRSGPVTKADVRQGVSALIGERGIDLPFKAYDVLEPIEHMLGLQGQREQDLLWLLLWRVANSSSLVVDEAQQSYIIDQSLLELDEFEGWKARLISLVDLEILDMPRPAMYRFRVPIFAEGFRAPRQQHGYHLRRQRAGT